ncbi:sugar transferase [Muricoccus radiodurans]|uniref:sugar transferase n=1 Tax=Muricoccus radiodurans TaxID=2231721 RepID=UPI003CEA9ECC
MQQNALSVPVPEEALLPADQECAAPLLSSPGARQLRRGSLLLRVADLLTASVGLVLTLPLLIVAALALRLESRGPTLQHQLQPGLDGRTFSLWMLRTTFADGVLPGAEVTRLGRLIRSARIDQLPVLLSVLRGDMALWGSSSSSQRKPSVLGWLKAG